MKQKLFVWLPVVVWCGMIFFFSSLPTIASLAVIWWDVLMKKGAHVMEFSVLYILVFRALVQTYRTTTRKTLIIIAILFSLSYAMSDEYHQMFTPGRTPTVRDVVIDATSIGLAAWYLHIKEKHHPSFLTRFVFGKGKS